MKSALLEEVLKFPNKLHVVINDATRLSMVVDLPIADRVKDNEIYERKFKNALYHANIRFSDSKEEFEHIQNASSSVTQPFIIDNIPMSGYSLYGCENTLKYYNKELLWTLTHPLGFNFYISSYAMTHLVNSCTIEDGRIKDDLVFICIKNNLALTIANSEVHQRAQAIATNSKKKINVEVGHKVKLATGDSYIYAGKNEIDFIGISTTTDDKINDNVRFSFINSQCENEYVILGNELETRRTYPSIIEDCGKVHNSKDDVINLINSSKRGHAPYIVYKGGAYIYAAVSDKNNIEVELAPILSFSEVIAGRNDGVKQVLLVRDNINGGFGFYVENYKNGYKADPLDNIKATGNSEFFFKPKNLTESEQLALLDSGIIAFGDYSTEHNHASPAYTQRYYYDRNQYKLYTKPWCIGFKDLDDSLLADANYSFFKLNIVDKITNKIYPVYNNIAM